MANKTFLAGISRFTINGTSWRVKSGSATIVIIEKKLEAIVGLNGIDGFKVTRQPCKIDLSVNMADNFSAKALEGLTDATVTVETRGGAQYMIFKAGYTGDGEIDLESGSVKITFEGETGREVLPL